jgi:hypothetical protein
VDLLRNVLRGSTVVLSAVHAQLCTVERSLSRSSYRPPPESLHLHSTQHSHHQHPHPHPKSHGQRPQHPPAPPRVSDSHV